MRKFAAWIHRYIGLALGALLLTSGLTGSLIVFQKPIDALLNDAMLQVQPQATHVSLDDSLHAARQAIPQAKASFVFLPESASDALEIRFQGSDLRAYVNPYTAELLGIRKANDSIMGFLVDLHVHLLSGKTGERIIGWSGLGAIILSLLGLWLWWPKRGRWKSAFSIKWHAAPVRIWLDVHKVAGAVICAFLILTAATGAALALYDLIVEPTFIALTGEGSRRPQPLSQEKSGAARVPLQPLLEHATAIFPDARITRITLPAKPQGAVAIRIRLNGEIHQFGRTFLWFDQYSGALLRVDNALKANQATRFQSWLFPLHTGVYGGTPTRWLQVLVGLSLSLLTLSGAWLWWKGYRARAAAARTRLRHAS